MTQLILTYEQKQFLETDVMPIIHMAKTIVVKNHEQKDFAVSMIKQWKQKKELIEDRFHPTENKKKLYEAYASALDTEKAFYEPFDQAVKIVTETVKGFERELALKQQREAEIAEAKRQEEERKERERLQKLADSAAAKGKTEKAATLSEQAQNVTIAPKFEPAPVATKKLVWKARVSNPLMACKSISEGLIPFNAIEFKQTALNDLGKSYDGKSKIAGIEFYQDVSSRI